MYDRQKPLHLFVRRQLCQGIPAQTVTYPFRLRLCPQVLIDADGGRVPVQHTPFETAAIAG